eukprot:snap_masked-scaffold_4-processed-gene-16.31-mRNA-1 protein AED:1.00 eAED:1.00 QI:0/0/0/0/1/1/2/0/60
MKQTNLYRMERRKSAMLQRLNPLQGCARLDNRDKYVDIYRAGYRYKNNKSGAERIQCSIR